MLGLGETREEVIAAMQDLRAVDCQRLTLGQYLRPSLAHLPVQRYWTPEEFDELGAVAQSLGFAQVRSGPLVRSSYHAAD
jgi:lipoic acid synthetase